MLATNAAVLGLSESKEQSSRFYSCWNNISGYVDTPLTGQIEGRDEC